MKTGLKWAVILRVVPWIALVLAIAWCLVGSPRGPVYRGRSVSWYFPRWVSSDGNSGLPSRWPNDAGPDAIPFLVEVLRMRDSGAMEFLVRTRAKLPGAVQDVVSGPRDAAWIRSEAIEYLWQITETPEGMRALSARFETLPADCQDWFLESFGTVPALSEWTVPLLRRAFHNSTNPRRGSAFFSMLRLGRPVIDCLPEGIQWLEQARSQGKGTPIYWSQCCRCLGRLGGEAKDALPLLRRLAESGDLDTRIAARLAIQRIGSPSRPFKDFFREEIIPLGNPAKVRFLKYLCDEIRERANAFEPDDVLDLIMPLVSEESCRTLLAPGGGSGVDGIVRTGHDLPGLLALGASTLGVMGRHAASAAPQLSLLLKYPNQEVRRSAALALSRIGAVALETVPRLIAGMSDVILQATLVPLLGEYGRVAAGAVPDLEALAAGQWREQWSTATDPYLRVMLERYGLVPKGNAEKVSEAQFHRMMMERYGLLPKETIGDTASNLDPRIPPALREAAKEALQKIRGSGGP